LTDLTQSAGEVVPGLIKKLVGAISGKDLYEDLFAFPEDLVLPLAALYEL
jgi:hypothetical protein